MAERDPLHVVELTAVLEEATSMLRHDLRNRLGSIRNMAYFVGKRVAGSEPEQKDARVGQFLTRIQDEVQKVDELIDAWGANLVRAHRPSAQSVSAKETIAFAVKSARVGHGVTVEVESEETMLAVDPLEFALALRHLIENAAEAIGSGRVSVAARVGESDGLYRVVVRNDGPGISEPEQVVRRFGTEKPGHVGLGLCIAQRVAQRYNGRLLIGAPEQGAEVAIEFPMVGRKSIGSSLQEG